MNERRKTVVKRGASMVVGLLAGALCSSAAGAPKDPLALALKPSDFPANTRLTSARYASVDTYIANAGFQGKSADYAAEISRDDAQTLYVSGRVVVLPTPAEARRMFAWFRREDAAVAAKLAKTVRLPRYGDEQSAFYHEPTRADLRVRAGTVVWRVEIKWSGLDKATRAQTLTELKTYATKLKARVGRG